MSTMVEEERSVAFIGLGAMGFAMSTHLVRQGISVVGYDVWGPSLEKFKSTCSAMTSARYSIASSPAEAVEKSNITLLMVATHHHVNSALFDPEKGAVKSIPANGTIIIASTVPPTYPSQVRQRLNNEFARSDIKLIDAPVSGGTVRSANGTLTIMSSSDDPLDLKDPAVNLVLSNLSSNGRTLFAIPGTLGAGTSAKALNQVQCGVHIVAGSEIMALAALNRLNTSAFYNTMKGIADVQPNERRYGWTWMFENRGPRMLDTALPISSAISIINKDVNIIKDEEARLDIDLPLLNQAQALLTETMTTMSSVDDAWINQFYLGREKPSRKELAAQQTDSSATENVSAEEQQSKTETLLFGHAVINFQSAYETFAFAEALDLLGEQQRQMWFEIIAGAAGGSKVFSEVIPEAFGALQKGRSWTDGFRDYAKRVLVGGEFVQQLVEVETIISDAKSQGVKPVLLETAMQLLQQHVV